jgi:hypothetical protein
MWRCHSVTSSLTKLLGALTWPRRRRPPCPRRPPLCSSHFVFRVHHTLCLASNDALSSGTDGDSRARPTALSSRPTALASRPMGLSSRPTASFTGGSRRTHNGDFVAPNDEDAAAAAGKAGAAPVGSSLVSLLVPLTSFLRQIGYSPAYSNLRTAFLSGPFNADAPDDPDVRHFFVAARAPSAYVWHPLWSSKLVLVCAAGRPARRERLTPALAAQARARRRRESRARGPGDQRAAADAELGADGPVSVRRARWACFWARLSSRTTGRSATCAAEARAQPRGPEGRQPRDLDAEPAWVGLVALARRVAAQQRRTAGAGRRRRRCIA